MPANVTVIRTGQRTREHAIIEVPPRHEVPYVQEVYVLAPSLLTEFEGGIILQRILVYVLMPNRAGISTLDVSRIAGPLANFSLPSMFSRERWPRANSCGRVLGCRRSPSDRPRRRSC